MHTDAPTPAYELRIGGSCAGFISIEARQVDGAWAPLLDAEAAWAGDWLIDTDGDAALFAACAGVLAGHLDIDLDRVIAP